MTSRLLPALLLVALLGAGTAALLGSVDETADGGAGGAYPARITGPDGDLWNGTVELVAGAATAHDALLAAGLAVDVEEHAGYRPCGTYVTAVGGHAEGGGPGGRGGWVYEVLRDGAWQRPTVGACAFPLQSGDAVWWRYVAEA